MKYHFDAFDVAGKIAEREGSILLSAGEKYQSSKETDATTAQVIVIGSRFFYGFRKNGLVKTTSRLAGAKLYKRSDSLQKIMETLWGKGKDPCVMLVNIKMPRVVKYDSAR